MKKFPKWKINAVVMILVIAVFYAFAVYNNIEFINSLPYPVQFIMTSGLIFLAVSFLFGNIFYDGDLKKYAGFFFIFLAVDLMLPPLTVSHTGEISKVDLVGAHIDPNLALLYSAFGVSKENLWFFVYPVSFFIFASAGIFLLTKRDTVKAVRSAVAS